MERINVIIVDDNETSLEGLSLVLLKNKNINVIDTCKNGKELVNNKNISKSNLVLIDLRMPEMGGIEAAKRISYSNPRLPMIAFSMYNESVYLEDIVCSGFKGYIHKPDIPKNLLKIIDQVLNNEYVFPKNIA
jgi:DNA-binding NarL/FixJ family response regulator